MGLWKAWKQVKAISATGMPTGQAPRGANNMAMGFAGAWMRMLGPLFASQAPERGSVLPGTEPDVQPLTADALAAGIAAVRARDSAFDPELLTAFAGQVFSAVAGAWASGDASAVRDVVSDEMWEPLAAASHAPIAAGLGQLIGRETGRPALTGVWAGAWYDSALFHIDVTVDVPPDAVRDAPPGLTAWDEEWLFQRSVTPGGSPSARPDHCPSCGAPTSIGPDGACTHCRAPVPVLTAGWLVTHVRSHNPLAAQMAGEASSLPPDLAQKLPPDVIAQVLRGGGPAGGSAR